MCEVEDCNRSAYSRGLCEPHYRRRLRTGRVSDDVPIGERPKSGTCMADRCDRVATERGLCHGHYLRLIRNGSIDDERPLDRRVNGQCTVPDCRNQATSRGHCTTHRRRLRTTGSVQADIPVKRVAGDGHINHGYRVVPVPRELRPLTSGRRTEFEHRLVMAQMLGRALTSHESVHHRDGDRLNNRPENLELWSRFQPSGQRVADKVAFAVALLEAYCPEMLQAQLPLLPIVEADDDDLVV